MVQFLLGDIKFLDDIHLYTYSSVRRLSILYTCAWKSMSKVQSMQTVVTNIWIAHDLHTRTIFKQLVVCFKFVYLIKFFGFSICKMIRTS